MLDILTIILKYVAIWILAPMMLGFFVMFAMVYLFNAESDKKPAFEVKFAQSNWVQRDLIGNTTERVHTIML
jgi:hypothetical protein